MRWQEKECRGPDPAAKAMILNANDRLHRKAAATTAAKQGGHGVDHGAAYKATAVRRQGFPGSHMGHW